MHTYLNPSLDFSSLLYNSTFFSLNFPEFAYNLVTTMHQSSFWFHYFDCMTLRGRVIKNKLCRNMLKIQWDGRFFYWFPLFPYWPHGILTSQTEVCLKQLENACILVILAGHPQILKKNSLNFIHRFYCLESNKWNDLAISHRCLCYFILSVGITQMLCVHELFGLP